MAKSKLPKYVRHFRDRTGVWRTYYRVANKPQIALRQPLYSEAFWADYQAACTGQPVTPKSQTGASLTKAGTFNDLIATYYKSAAFTSVAASTREQYRREIEPFRQEHGDKPVTALKAKHIDAILGTLALQSTSKAYKLRKRLVKLMSLAVKWEFIAASPMLNAERVKHKVKGYPTWTEDDLAKFRAHWPLSSSERIAFEIMLYTGLRRSDVAKLGRQHIQGDYIVISTKKSQEMVQLNIPIHPKFRPVLDSIKHNHLNLIINDWGDVRSEDAITNWIIDAAKAAKLPPHRSPHGLRKAACRRLAEAGADALQIMSITGHRDIKEIQTYCMEADQKRLANAAMNKVMGTA